MGSQAGSVASSGEFLGRDMQYLPVYCIQTRKQIAHAQTNTLHVVLKGSFGKTVDADIFKGMAHLLVLRKFDKVACSTRSCIPFVLD